MVFRGVVMRRTEKAVAVIIAVAVAVLALRAFFPATVARLEALL
jgi:hypothetical protein